MATYTITAALPYANGPLHIGHLAGVYIPADIFSRYQRHQGHRVLFVCGSDEHGVPIAIRAQKEGTTPQAVVDRYHALNKKAFEDLGISFDIFSRTSSPKHHEVASAFFTHLYEKGLLQVQAAEQYYDPEAQQFLADRYITGDCPKCGTSGAYGDQCEACGSSLSPTELVNPKSAVSGAVPILKKTTHWYLPLEDYEAWLKEWILKEHKDWKPNVYGQCKSWLEQGLQPRAITRDQEWGVPVPLAEAKGKVLYVWFDAPIGYISATQEWADAHKEDWKAFWQAPDTRLIHFIGKDNIVFHCIIFPAMLKAHGGYILPENVPANEFMNLEGQKISTSRDWAVWLPQYLEKFPDKQDVLRYVLCANMPENKDSDFTWEDFETRNNSELVAIVGNFVHRTLVLTHKYFDGKVPPCGKLTAVEEDLLAQLTKIPPQVGRDIERYHFRDALNGWLGLARLGNKYLADTEPWKCADTTRVATILYVAVQLVANLAVVGEPFLPHTVVKLCRMLQLSDFNWRDAGKATLIPAGQVLQQPVMLFEKIEQAGEQYRK